ncbi:hypothetical protein QEN19_001178 [Hanseniaspora menglaensis]
MDELNDCLPDLFNYYKHVSETKDYDLSLHLNNDFRSNHSLKPQGKGTVIINQNKFFKNLENHFASNNLLYKEYLMKGYRIYTLRHYEQLLFLLRETLYAKDLVYPYYLEGNNNHLKIRKLISDLGCFRTSADSKTPSDFNLKTYVYKTSEDYHFNADHVANEAFLENMFHLGETKHILLLGHDNHFGINDCTAVMENFVDITLSGKWAASTEKEENPINNILDSSIYTFWQSDGFLPHSIQVKFEKITQLNNILMFFSNKIDQSYSPYFIKIYGGTHEYDMVLLKSILIKNVEGWVNLFFYSDFTENKIFDSGSSNGYNSVEGGYVYNPPVDVKILKFNIFANQQKGKDSHLRLIRLIQDNNTNYSLEKRNNHYNGLTESLNIKMKEAKDHVSNKRKINYDSHLLGNESHLYKKQSSKNLQNHFSKEDKELDLINQFGFI